MSSPSSIIPSSDNEKGKNQQRQGRQEKFAMLNSYASDLAQYRNAATSTPAPDIPYAEDAPRCTDCKEYYYFDLESNRYNCPCPHSIKASDIQFHHANMNRHYKSLEERAAEFKRQRAEQFQTSTNYNNNPFTNRSRITTERGATNNSTGVPPGGSFDDSNH